MLLYQALLKTTERCSRLCVEREKAAAAVTAARADLFPQLNYQGDAMRQRQSINTLLWVKRSKGNLSVRKKSWLVHHGKSTCGAKSAGKTESATATLRSMAEAAHKAALSSVITSVVTTYLSILTVDETA